MPLALLAEETPSVEKLHQAQESGLFSKQNIQEVRRWGFLGTAVLASLSAVAHLVSKQT